MMFEMLPAIGLEVALADSRKRCSVGGIRVQLANLTGTSLSIRESCHADNHDHELYSDFQTRIPRKDSCTVEYGKSALSSSQHLLYQVFFWRRSLHDTHSLPGTITGGPSATLSDETNETTCIMQETNAINSCTRWPFQIQLKSIWRMQRIQTR